MKKVKAVTITISIFFCMLLAGESFQLYLLNFETEFTSTTFYVDAKPGNTEAQMIADITKAADKNDVEIFSLEKKTKSVFDNEIAIYGSDKVKSILKDKWKLEEKVYPSVLLGQSKISFHDFQELVSSNKVKMMTEYYLIGNRENCLAFKRELIGQYAGSFPKEGFPNDTKQEVMLIQLLAGLFILVVSLYEILFQRKEISVRLVFGEAKSTLIIRGMLADLVIFAASLTVSIVILKNYTTITFQREQAMLILGITVCANMLLYLSILLMDIKKVFSKKNISARILSVNYAFKFISTVITVIILATGIVSIRDSLNYYKQKDFFSQNKHYAYVGLSYDILERDPDALPIEKEAVVVNHFYKLYFEKYRIIKLILLDSSDGAAGSLEEEYGQKMILANKNVKPYLAEKIPEAAQASEEAVYCMIPESYRNEEALQMIIHENLQVRGFDTFDHIIFYKTGEQVGIFENNDSINSKIIKEPIVILDNRRPGNTRGIASEGQDIETGLTSEYSRVLMYQTDPDNTAVFEKNYPQYGIHATITNVWDNYLFHWESKKRILYIISVFSFMVLLLELFVIKTLISLEYRVNAMELTLKRVLGYSKWERYKKIILLAAIATFVSICAAILIDFLMGLGIRNYVILAGLTILALELSLIYYDTQKIEKANISKILKGGSL